MPISPKLKPVAARYVEFARENSSCVTREGNASFESSFNLFSYLCFTLEIRVVYRKSKRQVSNLGIGVIFKCNVTCGRLGFQFRLFGFCSAFDSAFGSKSVFVEPLDIDKVSISSR